MKTFKLLLVGLILSFAGACTEDSSLDGLESQTTDPNAVVGDNETSKAVKAMLTYENGLQYNWVIDYAPKEGQEFKLLFNFKGDETVTSDSPLSTNENRQAIYSVNAIKDGAVIRFEGASIFQDEMIEKEYRESKLYVVAHDENSITCKGDKTQQEIILKKASSADVAALGIKQVWVSLKKHNYMTGILRNAQKEFVARYEMDKDSKKISLTWIDEDTQFAQHAEKDIEVSVSETEYTFSWEAQAIHGFELSYMKYSIADETLSFSAAVNHTAPITVTPDYVDRHTKQYNLGGKSRSGAADPDLWKVLKSDKFRSIMFYVYPDDLPLRVESFDSKGNTSNHLFVNDYVTSPKKAAVYDVKGDWTRFYKSTHGDFAKELGANDLYPLAKATADLTPFLDFYFGEDGLYVIDVTDDLGVAFLLVSPKTEHWVKVRKGMISDNPDPIDPNANFLEQLIAKGMPTFGNFYDATTKNFKMHYKLVPKTPQSEIELMWLENEDMYTSGNYVDMAQSKLQYKTIKVAVSETGQITFLEKIKVGGVEYKGFSWAGGNSLTANVKGASLGMRTAAKEFNGKEIIDFFYTYTSKTKTTKYEMGSYHGQNNYLYTRLCMPTKEDNIAGMAPEKYMFYPYIHEGSGRVMGLNMMTIYSMSEKPGESNKQRIDLKSFKYIDNGKGGFNSSTQTYKMHITDCKMDGDRMTFILGKVEGGMMDENGKGMNKETCDEIALPLKTLLFSEKGFYIYKAEKAQYDKEKNKHYFYLMSPDPAFPYWVKVREA